MVNKCVNYFLKKLKVLNTYKVKDYGEELKSRLAKAIRSMNRLCLS